MSWSRSELGALHTRIARGALSALFLALGSSVGCGQSSGYDRPASAGGSAGATGQGGTGQSTGTGGSAGSGQSGGTAGGSAGAAGAATGTGGTSGTGGGAGSSGAGGSAGGSNETCVNEVKDPDETDVDCGGPCLPCVEYEINPPNLDNADDSTCNGGPGFMCPRAMLFSAEMVRAAGDDWGIDDTPFVYGVVGHNMDTGGVDQGETNPNACCQCYQLVFNTPDGTTGVTPPKPMIVQAFNTGANGFDIFMAVGGFGDFNGCTMGGVMYDALPELGDNFSGGVRASKYAECQGDEGVAAAACQSHVEQQCNLIEASSDYVEATSRSSCIQGNEPETLYHNNWNVKAKRVECPEGLTRVTGCKLNDQGLPDADPAIQTAAQATSGFVDSHTTSMQDCCRPTCAWPNNTSDTSGAWDIFYTCGADGVPHTQ